MGGQCVREYCYGNGEAEADRGLLTPEELSLGFDRFPHRGQAADCGNLLTEAVLSIASAWGLDPRFKNKTYPPSAGCLCAL